MIEIANTDDRVLDVVVDVLLQPTEVDEAGVFLSLADFNHRRAPITYRSRSMPTVQFIALDDHKSSGLIKGVQFGTIRPGVSVVKTLVLMSSGAPGDRTIDVSVQSSTTVPSEVQAPARAPSETLDGLQNHDTGEILRTLLIPTLSAFVVRQDVGYQRCLELPPALADLSVLEGAQWEGWEAVVMTVVECAAPCVVEVDEVALRRVVRAFPDAHSFVGWLSEWI